MVKQLRSTAGVVFTSKVSQILEDVYFFLNTFPFEKVTFFPAAFGAACHVVATGGAAKRRHCSGTVLCLFSRHLFPHRRDGPAAVMGQT